MRAASFALLLVGAGAAASDPDVASGSSQRQDRSAQWALEQIGLLPGRLPAPAPGPPVVVAVVDTGLDYHHPDFPPASLWRNPGEQPNGKDDDGNGYVDDLVGWNFADDDARPWDLSGHGTFVAGIIAARAGDPAAPAGVNPHAQIMPLRVLNFLGAGEATRVAEAIYYAVGNGARVINLSLGSAGASAAEARAIRYANERGVLVVVAAGNEGRDITGFGPAADDGVLTVAATDPRGARAGYSNWGAQVDLAAPGVDILSLRARRTDFILTTLARYYVPGSAFVGSDARHYRASGTSFAAPFVSAVASLIFAQRPELSGKDVRRMLLNSARDIETPGVDQYTGYGLLDARAALAADAKFEINAAITGLAVARQDGAQVVQVTGTATADQFAGAVVEIGAGEAPQGWTPVGELEAPMAGGLLTAIPAQSFAGSTRWTVRVVVRHANGRTREARYALNLG